MVRWKLRIKTTWTLSAKNGLKTTRRKRNREELEKSLWRNLNPNLSFLRLLFLKKGWRLRIKKWLNYFHNSEKVEPEIDENVLQCGSTNWKPWFDLETNTTYCYKITNETVRFDDASIRWILNDKKNFRMSKISNLGIKSESSQYMLYLVVDSTGLDKNH